MTLKAITAFRLTTADPARLAPFYEAIGFTIGEPSAIPHDELALLGVPGGGARLALYLGEQRVDLDAFEVLGRAYPTGSTAADLWFQHLAIVTSDACAAWRRAEAAGAIPISRNGPVKLPASAGGVTAVKFRDPEGHPLEFLQFPDAAAKGWPGTGMLGIGHSAISVADVDASRRFYEGLCLAAGDPSLNHGQTQVALDGLAGVEVDIVPMQPPSKPPHLELLGYRTPVGSSMDRLEANDIAATRVVWRADRDALLRDPDGHLHVLRR